MRVGGGDFRAVEAVFDIVLRYYLFPIFRFGAGGFLGVFLVGFDPSTGLRTRLFFAN